MERNFEAVWQMIRNRPFGWRLDWAESGMAALEQAGVGSGRSHRLTPSTRYLTQSGHYAPRGELEQHRHSYS
jgi:hypothetical protein